MDRLAMHILIVFVMLLGAAHVQTETFASRNECQAAGRELSEMLGERKDVKDAQWVCHFVTVGKPA
jgi:hypothetical protein